MIKKAFHDRLFLITTFPIALLAFEFVRWTIFDGGFLPFTVLLLLLLLSVAEPFAAFEIRRTNKIMNTEIVQRERPWYRAPFWSWEGIKERLSSVNAWFVVAYVFAAIFFSSLGVTILVLFWASVAVLFFALGAITPSNWNWVFSINGDDVSGKFSFLLDSEKFKLTIEGFQSSELSIPDQLTWVYTSGWTVVLCLFLILLNFLVIPVLAKHMSDVAAQMLGANSMAGDFEAKIKGWINARNKK
jgi:hypothetical protein